MDRPLSGVELEEALKQDAMQRGQALERPTVKVLPVVEQAERKAAIDEMIAGVVGQVTERVLPKVHQGPPSPIPFPEPVKASKPVPPEYTVKQAPGGAAMGALKSMAATGDALRVRVSKELLLRTATELLASSDRMGGKFQHPIFGATIEEPEDAKRLDKAAVDRALSLAQMLIAAVGL